MANSRKCGSNEKAKGLHAYSHVQHTVNFDDA